MIDSFPFPNFKKVEYFYKVYTKLGLMEQRHHNFTNFDAIEFSMIYLFPTPNFK